MTESEIRPGLFLGSLISLRNVRTCGVTHVLSVMKDAPSVKDMHPGTECEQLCLPVDDEEHEDILRHFAGAVAFLRKALAGGGKVLVHCVAGVSRSPTLVAAYLMATERLDRQLALKSIIGRRAVVQPNEGFLEQLGTWEEMGCTYDKSHPSVRRKALESLSEQHAAGQGLDESALADPADTPADETTTYRCRKCRTLVATSQNAMLPPAEASPTQRAPHFSGKRHSGFDASGGEVSQLFVEPMRWMQEAIQGQLRGKLYCPGCEARLGAFNWSGMQDSRGAWVTPAFELQLGRLDALDRSGEAAPARVHRPYLS